ncbi:hypothetical protein [Streptomyces sp. NPDC020983]
MRARVREQAASSAGLLIEAAALPLAWLLGAALPPVSAGVPSLLIQVMIV